MTIATRKGARLALVVDDNPQAAAISATMLESQGWTVDRAADGFEALVKVRARLYGAMMGAGEGLVSAHTDGLWMRSGGAAGRLEAEGWRSNRRTPPSRRSPRRFE